MKKLIIIYSILLFVGCNGPLNVPITKSLSLEVTNEMSQSDTSFVSFMESLNPILTWLANDNKAADNYGQITYEKVYKYYNYSKSIRYDEIFSEYCEKHPEYQIYKHSADSILNLYSAILPEDAVSVKLVGKKTGHDWLNDSYPIFVFEVTSLIGKIDQLAVSYDIHNKMYSTGSFNYKDCGTFYVKKPFDGTMILEDPCYIGRNTILNVMFKDLSYEDICTNYETLFEILDYQAKGQVYSKIPYEVRAYYDNKGTQYEDYYFNDIIKTYVAPNFTTPTEYYISIENEKLKKYDKKVTEMIDAYHEYLIKAL